MTAGEVGRLERTLAGGGVATPRAAPSAAADPGGRAPEIDAVRGWAALSVVCFHVFWETFGVVVPAFRNPYTAALLAGHFDVILFFILSGDALSFPFSHGGGARYLQRAALKRYPRLTVPIVVVTVVTALVMAVGLAPTEAAGAIVDRPDWLEGFARFRAAGSSTLRFAFYYVYAGGYRATYLPFLWTMPIELYGSAVLLLTLFVLPRVRGGDWFVAGIAYLLLSADSYLGCFLLGMLLGKARAAGVYAGLPAAFRLVGAPFGIALSLVLVGRRQFHADERLLDLALLGTVLLFCVYAQPRIVGLLSRNRLSQFLGRISYLLYLWHYVVLITMTSGLIVWSAGEAERLTSGAAIGIGVLTVLVSVALSRVTLPIEGWARDLNALILRLLWRDEGGRARNA